MWIDNKELSATEVKSKIHKLEKENAELKKILKQVADDIETYRIRFKEKRCVLGCEEECLFYNNGRAGCEYAHMPEIKKLIGEESDDK